MLRGDEAPDVTQSVRRIIDNRSLLRSLYQNENKETNSRIVLVHEFQDSIFSCNSGLNVCSGVIQEVNVSMVY